MKVALVQYNPLIGDIKENAHQLLALAEECAGAGAELVVFPELSLTGAPLRDLLERPAFIQGVAGALEGLASRLPAQTDVVVGAPLLLGGGLRNAALVIRNGQVVHTIQKHLFSTDAVFDEARYFVPGEAAGFWKLKHTGEGPHRKEQHENDQIGCAILGDADSGVDPFERPDSVGPLADQGVALLVNLAASPFEEGRPALRQRMAQRQAEKHGLPVVLVNQVGGNDELIFDGSSFVVWPDGETISCNSFAEDCIIVDTTTREVVRLRGERSSEERDEVFDALVLGVRDYAKKCGFRQALLGLSGGIDSALVAVIAVQALGPDNVIGVTMPSSYSSAGSVEDSYALAANLGMRVETIPIADLADGFGRALAPLFAGTAAGLAEENVQARIRGTLLMSLSNKFGWLLLTTGNKSELATGYCTLYGDMNGGLSVLGDLFKTKVYELSRWVNRASEIIPPAILEKPPSAELRPGQKDSDSLPDYSILDRLLFLHLEKQLDAAALIESGLDAELVGHILGLVKRSEYKRRQAAPILRVSGKAFGQGRRLPLAARVRY